VLAFDIAWETGETHEGFRWGGKLEGKRPLGTTRRTCVDNIKMDLQEVRWGSMDCD